MRANNHQLLGLRGSTRLRYCMYCIISRTLVCQVVIAAHNVSQNIILTFMDSLSSRGRSVDIGLSRSIVLDCRVSLCIHNEGKSVACCSGIWRSNNQNPYCSPVGSFYGTGTTVTAYEPLTNHVLALRRSVPGCVVFLRTMQHCTSARAMCPAGRSRACASNEILPHDLDPATWTETTTARRS